MKVYIKTMIVLLCSVLFQTAYAQGAHWSVNAYDYRYDMTVYYGLSIEGVQLSEIENLEVAAFVGNECRGIGTVQNHNGNYYGYLRIRSNKDSGETVSFKVYNRWAEVEKNIANTNVTFKSQEVVGLPSSPLILDMSYLLGDANSDGKVSITDAVAVVNYILGNTSETFHSKAADVNKDNAISITDAVGVVNIILNKEGNNPAPSTLFELGEIPSEEVLPE